MKDDLLHLLSREHAQCSAYVLKYVSGFEFALLRLWVLAGNLFFFCILIFEPVMPPKPGKRGIIMTTASLQSGFHISTDGGRA